MDVMGISRKIDAIINETVLAVFVTFRDVLMREPIEYIVPAVWGVKKDGTLDPTQTEIFQKTDDAEKKIKKEFVTDTLSDQQAFAFEYLIKSLFIARLTQIIEQMKNLTSPDGNLPDDGTLSKLQ